MKTKTRRVSHFSEQLDPQTMSILSARYQQRIRKAKKWLMPSHFAWILGLLLTTVALPGFTQEVTIWNQAATPVVTAEADANPVELGVKFRVTAPGHIIGLWFYKGLGNDGLHTGNLWLSDGTLVATIDFTGETPTGWQRADFPVPVPVSVGQTYVVSYFAPQGNYAVDQSFFAAAAVVTGSLTLLQNGIDGDNGLYGYNPTSIFPGSSYEASNYWVDPIYISADTDSDGDGILNANDNCPVDFNPGQEDDDLDGVGDVCDTVVGADSDNDGIADGLDNCPVTPNTDQLDDDVDGIGNACEPDTDNDGVINDVDNCHANPNPGQEDSDSNGIGDSCDFSSEPDGDTLGDLNCNIQQIAKFNGTQWVCADEAQGPVGADGAKGDTGSAGIDGSAGTTGPQGIQGPAGIDADPTKINALQAQIDALQAQVDALPVFYKIGDTGPGGGIVFHITNGGINGLEAAPVDQANATWCNTLTDLSIPNLRTNAGIPATVGDGSSNTNRIVDECIDTTNSAAKIASVYQWPSGVTDGFLPSIGELGFMRTNLYLASLGGFANDNYWSSTEFDSEVAWFQYFPGGGQGLNNKDEGRKVRAVRAF